MDCEGRRGILNYTCPVYYPVSSCTYWDTKTLSWSDEGCKYWKTDDVNGVAYCNCTHLTAFTSDVQSELQSSSSFADTTRSAEDLSIGLLNLNSVVAIKAGALLGGKRSSFWGGAGRRRGGDAGRP